MNQFRPTGYRRLPPVIKNLLIINGLFFLAELSIQSVFKIDIVDYLGLHYFSAEKFNPYQFITYMFLHGGFTHILFNMFALWMFGNVLENIWGGKRFLFYYIFTGIGAGLTHYIIFYFQMSPVINHINVFLSHPSLVDFKGFIESGNFKVISYDIQNHYNAFISQYNGLLNSGHNSQALSAAIEFINQYKVDFLNTPVVIGASGAVFGLLLAFGMMFPNSLIYVYFAIPVKAKWFVMIYGALELYSGFQSSDNVAHFAHLGGMLFGFILLMIWKKNQFKNKFNKF